MDELESMNTPDTEQEATQDAQEAPVTVEADTGGETDPQEPEAPQEAAKGQETGTQEAAADPPQEDAQPEGAQDEAQEPAPQEEAPQDAQEALVTVEADTGGETDPQEPEAPQEAAEGQKTGTQEETTAEPAAAQAEGDARTTLGSGRLGGGLVTPDLAVITPTATLLASQSAAADGQETDEEYEALDVNALDVVKLGRQGEHLTQQVVIDCAAWLDKLPGCTLLIAAIRPTENAVYLPTVTVTNGVITWDIQGQDTAKGGWGRGEVRAMKDGKIKKSAVFRTRVEPSLEGSGAAPATPPDWVQAILDSVAAAQAAAEEAAASAVLAAANTRGLAGWSLTREDNGTVTIDYNEESEG